jgi:hypothetical protein
VIVDEQQENHYAGPERRRSSLSPDDIEAIKNQILDSIYADIGKSVVTRLLWIGGAVLTALFAWLSLKGHIKID